MAIWYSWNDWKDPPLNPLVSIQLECGETHHLLGYSSKSKNEHVFKDKQTFNCPWQIKRQPIQWFTRQWSHPSSQSWAVAITEALLQHWIPRVICLHSTHSSRSECFTINFSSSYLDKIRISSCQLIYNTVMLYLNKKMSNMLWKRLVWIYSQWYTHQNPSFRWCIVPGSMNL